MVGMQLVSRRTLLVVAGLAAGLLSQVATQDSAYKVLVSPSATGEDLSESAFEAISAHLGLDSTSLQLKRQYAGPAVQVYSATSTKSLSASDLCAAITTAAGAAFCEADVQTVANGSPSGSVDDPLFSQQWDLEAIKVPEVWAEGITGDKNIRVCTIDTGIDATHPDLVGNLWTNPHEIAGNGVDDDGDGIVDDVHGASFLDGGVSGDPTDKNGHGTFVAGVIAAVGNNSIGISGINQKASVIACQSLDASGNGWISDGIQCIDYCISKDAHIITLAWGGVAYSQALQDAVSAAEQKGILLVTAAGPNGTDIDQNPYYPASLNNSNMITAAASTNNSHVWSRSNYGKNSVEVMAPGVDIVGLNLGGTYFKATGTSFAAAHVAGAAALILQKFAANGWDIDVSNHGLGLQVKQLIIAGSSYSQNYPQADASKLAGGLLDVYAAVQLVPAMPKTPSIADLVNEAVSGAANQSPKSPSETPKSTKSPAESPKSPAAKTESPKPAANFTSPAPKARKAMS